MVRIEYWSKTLFPPAYNGAFIASITVKEVIPNITQESTRENIPFTQSKYQNFLQALQSLNINVREKADNTFVPGSFVPARWLYALFTLLLEIGFAFIYVRNSFLRPLFRF